MSLLHYYPIVIKEIYLDTFGHMNNATYLLLFEEARWDLINQRGYGMKKIKELKLGPTILEAHVRYLKELRLREEIIIETTMVDYERKIGTIEQRMVRGQDICCIAQFKIALFDLNVRRLVPPTQEWLNAIGYQPTSENK